MRLLLAAGWARGIVFLLALVAAAVHPTKVQAHASLIRSEPSDRAVVAQAPATLKLTFNEPVSPVVLRLVGPTGETMALKDILMAGNTIAATLPSVFPQGTHLVSWRVISLDGHPVGGSLMFSVGAPSMAPAARPQTEAHRSLRLAIWLTGGAFYAAWIAIGPLAPRTRKLVAAALECGLAAAVTSVGLQGVDVLGLPLSELRKSHAWMARLATWACMGQECAELFSLCLVPIVAVSTVSFQNRPNRDGISTRKLTVGAFHTGGPMRIYRSATTQLRMPTARDATSAMVASEIADSAIMSSLALTVSGKVSEGENAVAFVNAKKR